MFIQNGILAAVSYREYTKADGELVRIPQATVIDAETGRAGEPIEVNHKTDGLVETLLANVLKPVVIKIRHSVYWNDTPQGRRPSNNLRVVACEALKAVAAPAAAAPVKAAA